MFRSSRSLNQVQVDKRPPAGSNVSGVAGTPAQLFAQGMKTTRQRLMYTFHFLDGRSLCGRESEWERFSIDDLLKIYLKNKDMTGWTHKVVKVPQRVWFLEISNANDASDYPQ